MCSRRGSAVLKCAAVRNTRNCNLQQTHVWLSCCPSYQKKARVDSCDNSNNTLREKNRIKWEKS